MNSLARWQLPEFSMWPTFSPLTNLRDTIDRLSQVPWTELTRTSQLLSGWTPAFDVFEDKDNVYVRAELPGMRKEDIDLTLHNGNLSVSGERRTDQELKDAEVYRAERFSGRFQRTISLPAEVAADKIKAQYKDGILNVTLPKAEEAKPKQIDVIVS